MTAQIANGGHKIYPKIIADNKNQNEPFDIYTGISLNVDHFTLEFSFTI